MDSTLLIILSLFTLLLIALGVYFISKKIRLPYTVMLVFCGLLLVPLSKIPFFSFITAFELTPDLLFFVFLPTLLFESSFNMSVKRVLENIKLISLLAIGSMIVSSFAIATGLYYIFIFVGFPVPFIVFLLFGTLISATDPVAVLSLFKQYGAPKRLSLLFEGESLFNDGTAFVLFLVLLDIFAFGWHGVDSVLSGLFMFISMTLGGVLFGIFMGVLFSKLIQLVKDNEHVEITLTMIVAHLTFLLAEVITHHEFFGGFHIYLSSIIATVVASMVIGNYGRSKISPRVLDYMEKFWSYFAFIANSIIFILLGFLFSKLPLEISNWIIPIIIAIVVTMIARALSIYPIIFIYNRFFKEKFVPVSWQHLLAWGSLRGALAITMVFLIPDDLTVSGWAYAFSPKDLIMTITIGTIYFTLFVKATTIGPLMGILALNSLTKLEKMEYEESKAIIYARVLFKLTQGQKKGYIKTPIFDHLHEKYQKLYIKACAKCNQVSKKSPNLQNRALFIYAVGIERIALKTLYTYEEVSERIYKKIDDNLLDQLNYLQIGRSSQESLPETYHEDMMEKFLHRIESMKKEKVHDQYLYYRARAILARKVIKELLFIDSLEVKIFNNLHSIEQIVDRYTKFEDVSKQKLAKIQERNAKQIIKYDDEIAERGVYMNEEKLLNNLQTKEMVTPKVYLMLRNEFKMNSNQK